MVTMLQVYKTTRYLLIERCLCILQASRFCHLEKPVAFEFFSGVVYGGDCPLGCIAVAACCCSSSGY